MAKKSKKRPLTLPKIKRATRGINQITRAQKKLNAMIKKHKQHLTAMFHHNI